MFWGTFNEDDYDPELDGFAYPLANEVHKRTIGKCHGCGRTMAGSELCYRCLTYVYDQAGQFQVEFDAWCLRTHEGQFAVAYAEHRRKHG